MSDDVEVSQTGQTSYGSGLKSPKGELVEVVNDWQPLIDAIENRIHPKADEFKETQSGQLKARKDHQPPKLDVPGFGEELDDCGDYIPESMRFCVECGKVHDFARNCYRYDCPKHAPYAVRRRAAGSESGPGLAAQLDGLIRWLGAYHDRRFDYSHIVLRPHPDDVPIFESKDPLGAMKEIGREFMDLMGVQGMMAYHPISGENEDIDEDDRGKWRFRLAPNPMTKENLESETEYKPHLHMIVVHPHKGLDFRKVEQLEEATGWIATRLVDDENISIDGDSHMARALTYCLSHAGVYEKNGQRRLAAWMKGPDVNDVQVLEHNKRRMSKIVHSAAREVLGISPPDLDCDANVDADTSSNVDIDRKLMPFDRHSQQEQLDEDRLLGRSTWNRGPGPSINTATTASPTISQDPWGGSSTHVEGVGGMSSSPDDLPPESDDGWSSGGSSASSSGSSVSKPQGKTGETADSTPDNGDIPECGGRTRHISKAGEYLTDPEWVETAPFADDLDASYRSYVRVMERKDADPLDTEALIPEEQDGPPD